MHRLLARQLRKCTRGDGGIEVERLLELVDLAYGEADAERERQDNANRVMSQEVEDLSAQVRAESEARVRAVLDHVADGIVTVDALGVIERANPAAAKMFGFSIEEIVGRPAAHLFEWSPTPGTAEGIGQHADGSTFVLENTTSTLTEGAETLAVCVVRDVSARREAENALRDATAKAQAASRAKSDFLATMSHEIRTPMNGVLGMVGLMLDTDLDAVQSSYATAIRESAEALLDIINDILDFSKIEAGKMQLERNEFELAPVVESVVEIVAPRAHAKGLEIGCLVSADVQARVVGDAGRLRQVLLNLVGNAVKFTEDGEVTVEATLDGFDSDGRARVRFEVKDTGIGISAEDGARLFQEFVQVDSSSTRKFGGTGLGLAICRRIVQLMGGEIGFRPGDERGTVFWFVVPFAASEALSGEVLPDDLRVLVVDDNATNLRIFERQLSAWGIGAVTASSGDAALAAFVKAHASGTGFDLAIVDHQMPGMDGETLATMLKAMPMFAGTPLLLASSDGPEALSRARQSGRFEVVFTKPVRPSALRRAIATHAIRVRAERAAAAAAAAPAAPTVVEPSRAQTPARAPSPEPPPTAVEAGRRLRILVADDNHINTRVAMGYLERAGHRVDTAANGVEAVSAVRARPYDVVLMDVQMPELDGLGATKAIRALGGVRSRVPIVALTANAQPSDRERCLEAGMDDYLPKPFVRAQLLEKVAAWGERQAAPESGAFEASTAGLHALEADLGPEAVAEVTNAYVGSAREHAEMLGQPLHDLGAVARRLHSLRGSSAELGFDAVAHRAKTLELAAKDGRTDEVRAGIPDLLAAIEAACAAIEAFRGAAEASGIVRAAG